MNLKILTATASLVCFAFHAEAGQSVDRYDSASRPVIASKGTFVIGGSAGFSAHSNSDFSFPVVENVNSVGFNIDAAPEFCYFFNDNEGVGVRFSYGRSMLSVGNAAAGLGDISLGFRDYFTVNQNFSLTAFMRYYIPLGDSRRVAFHVDAGLQSRFGQAKQTDEHTGDVIGTWQTSWKAGIVVNPGMTVLLGGRTSLFVAITLADISYGKDLQVHNQVQEGRYYGLSASFLPNLAALSFGIDFNLGRK